MAPEFFVIITDGATIGDKVGIMKTFGFHWMFTPSYDISAPQILLGTFWTFLLTRCPFCSRACLHPGMTAIVLFWYRHFRVRRAYVHCDVISESEAVFSFEAALPTSLLPQTIPCVGFRITGVHLLTGQALDAALVV